MAKQKKTQGIGLIGASRDNMVGASRDIVVGGSILGIGATIVARTGGPTAGISAAASFLPVIGVTVGGGLALQQLRRLQGRKR